MSAPLDVLAVMDQSISDPSNADTTDMVLARAAVAELVAAAASVTSGHCSMATVKGRLEMQRRLNTLSRALRKFGGAE